MDAASSPEPCPLCGDRSYLRPKVVLIDEAWADVPGKDPRLKYFADLRVDDVKPDRVPDNPLEQFVSGYYCDKCDRAFVSEADLLAARRRYK